MSSAREQGHADWKIESEYANSQNALVNFKSRICKSGHVFPDSPSTICVQMYMWREGFLKGKMLSQSFFLSFLCFMIESSILESILSK